MKGDSRGYVVFTSTLQSRSLEHAERACFFAQGGKCYLTYFLGMLPFGFEPADIAVRTGRVDLMLRDENEAYWHIEEQRNLRKEDMYRFAAYHSSARNSGVRA